MVLAFRSAACRVVADRPRRVHEGDAPGRCYEVCPPLHRHRQVPAVVRARAPDMPAAAPPLCPAVPPTAPLRGPCVAHARAQRACELQLRRAARH
eukprot:377027-Pleurochrysis_carterae.AAC.1